MVRSSSANEISFPPSSSSMLTRETTRGSVGSEQSYATTETSGLSESLVEIASESEEEEEEEEEDDGEGEGREVGGFMSTENSSLGSCGGRDHSFASQSGGSRTPSPADLFDDEVGIHQKDHSPSQETISLETEMAVFENQEAELTAMGVGGADEVDLCGGGDLSESLTEYSVMCGGTTRGWLPEVTFALWSRMLGILGNVNHIREPAIHAQVMGHLHQLWQSLEKIRRNQGISVDNQSTPPPPSLVPPLTILAPWLFQAVRKGSEFKEGVLCAYRLLCAMTVRRQDVPLSPQYLANFYCALHLGLVGTNQEVINTLVRHCGSRFFCCGLPGCTALVLDFVHASNMVVSTSDLEAPRLEAMSLLASMVCFPHHYSAPHLQVLQPTTNDFTTITCRDHKDSAQNCNLKEHLLNILLKASKKEPSREARCIAICSLATILYHHFQHGPPLPLPLQPKHKEAVNILLATLKFSNKLVARVASDMLLLLSEQTHQMNRFQPELPKKIIEVLTQTISSLLPAAQSSESDEDKKLIVSLLFCLLEWCLQVSPTWQLGEPRESSRGSPKPPLLQQIFEVLKAAEEGAEASSASGGGGRQSSSFSEVAYGDRDPYDSYVHLDSIRDGQQPPTTPSLPTTPKTPSSLGEETPSEDGGGSSFGHPTIFEDPKLSSSNTICLAARTVRCYLTNRLGHFPLGGPAQVTSQVQEYHDNPQAITQELSDALLAAPNTQVFVFNQALFSLVEIPAECEVPVPGGLQTSASQVRLIVRDLAGKQAWDAAVLHAPHHAQPGGPQDLEAATFSGTSAEVEQQRQPPTPLGQGSPDAKGQGPEVKKRRSTLLTWQEAEWDEDLLDQLLQFVGDTSRECLLRPGRPLNAPAPPSREMEPSVESCLQTVLDQQRQQQAHLLHIHQANRGRRSRRAGPSGAKSQQSSAAPTPAPPFQQCRLLLNQLGFLSWEKRPEIHLLKKNSKLVRELNNLDSQPCRETHKIAVLYVAEGQEDKHSILSNMAGSRAYEDFIASMAWEVDLETHRGFMGGLQRNKSTGETAPYYATPTLEVIFHIATRMPVSDPATFGANELNRKLRHLGNDEVHIVWSEHSRNYRRTIIATEFGDVIIIIYPLPNHLYQIQIQKKPEVPFFGPLFDGAVVDGQILPGLIRATALNASCALRALLPFYRSFYEERAKYIENVISNYTDHTSFEDFSAQVYRTNVKVAPSPSPPPPLFLQQPHARGQPQVRGHPQQQQQQHRMSPGARRWSSETAPTTAAGGASPTLVRPTSFLTDLKKLTAKGSEGSDGTAGGLSTPKLGGYRGGRPVAGIPSPLGSELAVATSSNKAKK